MLKISKMLRLIILGAAICLAVNPSRAENFDPNDLSLLPAKDLLADIQKVKHIIDTTRAAYSSARGEVLVLGRAQSGKSTLIKLLTGRDNLAVEGHDPGATIFPVPSYDENTQLIFWECPGFLDEAQGNQAIINAFILERLVSDSKVEILLVLPDPDLDLRNNRSSRFYRAMEELTSIFVSEGELKSMLSTVVTHSARISPHVRVNTLLRETQNSFAGPIEISDVAKRLITFLHTTKNVLSSIPKTGHMDPQAVRTSIARAGLAHNAQIDIKKAINQAAREYVLQSALNLNDLLSGYMQTKAVRDFFGSCHKAIADCNEVQRLRVDLATKKSALLKLKQVGPDSPLEFVQILAPFIATEEIVNIVELLIFHKKLNHEVVFNIEEWAASFLDIVVPNVDSLIAPPKVTYAENGKSLRLSGFLVSISDIKGVLRNTTTQVQVLALNTIYLDDSLTIPSGDIFLVGNRWKVTKASCIDLSGLNGAYGQPGAPGGDFYGKSCQVINRQLLRIKNNGGDGHDGNLERETSHRVTAEKIDMRTAFCNLLFGKVFGANDPLTERVFQGLNQGRVVESCTIIEEKNTHFFCDEGTEAGAGGNICFTENGLVVAQEPGCGGKHGRYCNGAFVADRKLKMMVISKGVVPWWIYVTSLPNTSDICCTEKSACTTRSLCLSLENEWAQSTHYCLRIPSEGPPGKARSSSPIFDVVLNQWQENYSWQQETNVNEFVLAI
jgi:hypothetical protein